MQSRYDCWVNHNLEAMAKQLYDYWFVQFDFPNENGRPYKSSGGKMVWNDSLAREIPEGWNISELNKWLEIKSGFAFKSDKYVSQGTYKVITIKNVQEHHLDTINCDFVNEIPQGLKDWCILSVTDRLISLTGNCGRLCIVTEENLLLNQRVGLLSCREEYLDYVYLLLSSKEYQILSNNLATGAAQANLSPVELCKSMAIVPPKEVLYDFNQYIRPIIENFIQNEIQITTLTKQRNELLPLLMNGQVKVGVERSRLNYDLLFCPFAHFLYNATKNPMKEEVKTRIVTAMAQNLSPEQLLFLNTVLNDNFKSIEIKQLGDEVSQRNKANNELLNAFIAAKKIEGCSDKTLHYYRSSIEALLAKLTKKIDVIVTDDIRNYLSDYQEERLSSRVTIDNLRRIFSSFFAWLEDEDYIGKSPVRRIHKVRTESLVKEVLSDENMEVLRDTCHEMRDLAMVDLLASTGMRVGELAKMNREDIDFQERQCVVFGKGNKEREVYFNARTKIHLKRYLESRKDNNPALFVSLSSPHNRLTISGVEVRLRQLGRKAGISKVHPHKFRRTLATMAIDKGMPIEQVQKLLGHVKIDTTLHYAMVNQTNVKIAHRKFIG